MATIAAAIVGAGATYYASKQASKKSKAQRDAESLVNKNAGLSSTYGEEMLGYSKDALSPVYDYYRKLGAGDRNTMMQYLKPQIESQSDSSRRAFQTASELSPRSGIDTAATSRIATDNAANIAKLLNSARSEGISGLGTLGTNWGNMGLAGLNQGSAGANQIVGYERQTKADQSQAGAAAGDSAYNIFKLFQEAMAGRGTSAGGVGSANTSSKGSSGYGGYFW